MKLFASRFYLPRTWWGTERMPNSADPDFERIAAELRDEAARAVRAAAAAPDRSDALRRKARNLERAAERIEEDANARAGHVLLGAEDEGR